MNKLYYQLGAAFSVALATSPLTALAVTSPGLTSAQEQLGQVGTVVGTSDPLPTVIGRFINVILGIMGILLVVYFVYAGFLYMTAAGDDKKVGHAKEIMKTAVVGLVIVVFAYAAASFVITQLTAI